MGQQTDRWGLNILGPGSRISDDGYKFSDADRRLIDRLLAYAAEQHHHSGAVGSDLTPSAPPALSVANTGGAIPSGGRYYYRYTIIDENDNESAPSPVSSVDMPIAVSVPVAPTLSTQNVGGTLGPGAYSYVLSAYTTADTLETKAINSAYITVVGTTATNQVTLILPALPPGGLGFNIYRKAPSGLHYLWLEAIDAPAPLDTWVDTGAVDGDCDRGLPKSNRTSNANKVTVAFPGATPAVPEGFRWRIYRSADPNGWGHSYLTELVPIGATPYTPVTFVDVGGATQVGGPPTKAQVINAPPKIDLGTEAQGSLPPGCNVVPYELSFALPGPVTAGDGTFQWVCDFDQADVLGCRAFLGVDKTPAADDVIVDVVTFRPDRENAWTSIYTTTANRPTVPVGTDVGTRTVPDLAHLVAGDALTVNVIQSGGGATPTDEDLTVNVLLMVVSGSSTVSYPWEET